MPEEKDIKRSGEFRLSLEAAERKTPDVIPLHRAVMREMAEPRDGLEPVPVWLILGFLALAGWAGFYIATNSGGFAPDQYNERAQFAAKSAEAPKAVDPMVLGRRTFNNCVTCHQQNGEGVPGAFPPLAGSELVNGAPDRLAALLLHGLNGPLEVKGTTYNGEMPEWGSKLKDDQIAAVLTYIRASFGNNAPAVSPDLVKQVREATASRNRPWTEAELKQFRLGG
jgi:mono/diheme cytochrome c family protein